MLFQGVLFPAHAGMNRESQASPATSQSVPRPRGDEPVDGGDQPVLDACSPPTRG